MGMFDRLYCHLPLPDQPHDEAVLRSVEFQTKDVLNDLVDLVITSGGRLMIYGDEEVRDLDFHGSIHFYSYNEGTRKTYLAFFYRGQLISIKSVK